MNKLLQREDINLVKPKFRDIVIEAWNNGEDVPYGVIYLDDRDPTEEEIDHIRQLIKEGKITDGV